MRYTKILIIRWNSKQEFSTTTKRYTNINNISYIKVGLELKKSND